MRLLNRTHVSNFLLLAGALLLVLPSTPLRALSGGANSTGGLADSQKKLSAGAAHTCAIGVSNQVYCWGWNYAGQFGNGNTTDSSTAVSIAGWSGTAIAAGDEHTCVLGTTGAVTCAGYGTFGTLGGGNNNSSSTPVTAIASGASKIFAGTYFNCALLINNTAQCWGHNTWGQLGDGTWNHKNVPTTVVGVSGIQDMSLGAISTCALVSGGAVKCWGDNSYGQLGNGGVGQYSFSAVDVTGLSSGVVALASSAYSHCAVLSTGTVKCWGRNRYGQLGNGTTTNSNTPVSVSGLNSRVHNIAGQGDAYCVITETYSTYCWGGNGFGELGDGTTTDRSAPVAVSGVTGAVAVSRSNFNTCVVLNTGGAKCWGRNHVGQLGNNSGQDSNTQVDVIGFQTSVTPTTTTTITSTTVPSGAQVSPTSTVPTTSSPTQVSSSVRSSTQQLPTTGSSPKMIVAVGLVLAGLGGSLLRQRRTPLSR
jgi:LPXTG-motif cell wall-anchored protein